MAKSLSQITLDFGFTEPVADPGGQEATAMPAEGESLMPASGSEPLIAALPDPVLFFDEEEGDATEGAPEPEPVTPGLITEGENNGAVEGISIRKNDFNGIASGEGIGMRTTDNNGTASGEGIGLPANENNGTASGEGIGIPANETSSTATGEGIGLRTNEGSTNAAVEAIDTPEDQDTGTPADETPITAADELTGLPVPSDPAQTPASKKATPSGRGRRSLKEIQLPGEMPEIPDDEVLFSKQYYSMGEVSAMFRENQSLIRYWETEFDILQPKKNGKGDRFFRPVDVKNLVMIYDLLRRRKFTIEGAKEYLKNDKRAEEKFQMIRSLGKIRSFLLELKAGL